MKFFRFKKEQPPTSKGHQPFRESLKQHESMDRAKLQQLENRPDLIVRSVPLGDWLPEGSKKETQVEAAKNAIKLMKELESNYGVCVSTDYIIGHDEHGNSVVYAVSDKIEGGNLKDKERLQYGLENNVLAEELEKLYASLIQYALDKYQSGEYFLVDIGREEQYVFGKKRGDKNPHVYLVDVDVNHVYKGKRYIFYLLEDIIGAIESMESFTNRRFEAVRNKLEELVDAVPNEEKEESIYEFDAITRLLNKTQYLT